MCDLRNKLALLPLYLALTPAQWTLRYRSQIHRALRTLALFVPLLFGVHEEKQEVTLVLLERYVDSNYVCLECATLDSA